MWRPHPTRAERGFSIAFVAVAMVLILGMAALAIDLVMLYVGRSEAQRAADSAALAGALAFVDSTCMADTSGAACQALCNNGNAFLAAKQAAYNNKVGALPGDVQSGDVTCDTTTHPGNPLITVQVKRVSARGNAMPTLFSKFFGRNAADVAAKATAEAYAGDINGPNICLSCVRPFAIPNCTDVSGSLGGGGGQGGGGGGGGSLTCNASGQQFINDDGTKNYSVVGQTLTFHDNNGPSHWELVNITDQSNPSTPEIQGSITACTNNPYTCGDHLTSGQGDKLPVLKSVCQLITYNLNTSPYNNTNCTAGSAGTVEQDTIDNDNRTIRAGTNNPLVRAGAVSAGGIVRGSDAVMTLPVMKMSDMASGLTSYTIVGYMQVFVKGARHSGNDSQVQAVVLDLLECNSNAGACGNGGSSGTGGTVSGGSSGVPIRLVKNP